MFLKLLGLLLILTASSLAGIYKSLKLRERTAKLNRIYRSLTELRERVRLSSGEIGVLLNICFGNDCILKDGCFTVNENELSDDDIKLLNEFLSEIGMSDASAECDRIELYAALVLKSCNEAEQKCRELCRLYNTLGILCGIFICIFFL